MNGPPVYRPQPVKLSPGTAYRANSAAVQRMPAGAPPVYRPITQRAMAAPPVYRPNSSGAQRMLAAAPSVYKPSIQRAGSAPPVYRPGSPGVQRMLSDVLSIGFTTQSGRGRDKVPKIPIDQLKKWQLSRILIDPNDSTIVYSGDKESSVRAVRARYDKIQEDKLKKQADGGVGYLPTSDRYVVAPFPRPSTPERSALESGLGGLKFEVVEPRTPPNYGAYPPDVVHSPGGTEARRSAAYGGSSPGGSFYGVAIYSHDAPERKNIYTTDTPTLLPKTPIPCADTPKDSGWQRIDRARLKRWAAERKTYRPSSSAAAGESSGQNGAMGNISAKEAAADSGYTSGEWDWLHLMAFTLGGIGETRINHPDNLVAGTLGANRVHKVVEDTVKKLIIDNITAEVYVRARAEIKSGSYHVCTKLEYGLYFRMGMIPGSGEEHRSSFEINPLDPNPAQGGNLHILLQTLCSVSKIDSTKGGFFP